MACDAMAAHGLLQAYSTTNRRSNGASQPESLTSARWFGTKGPGPGGGSQYHDRYGVPIPIEWILWNPASYGHA
jgi:hypothetical protein